MNYVVGFMYSRLQDKVILVQKINPEWQRDLYNGVGGKIEKDETPIDAMVREFKEETKIFTTVGEWKLIGIIEDGLAKVYFYTCEKRYLPPIDLLNDNSEPLAKISIRSLLDGLYKEDVVLNLNWIIPYIYYGDPDLKFYQGATVAHDLEFQNHLTSLEELYKI